MSQLLRAAPLIQANKTQLNICACCSAPRSTLPKRASPPSITPCSRYADSRSTVMEQRCRWRFAPLLLLRVPSMQVAGGWIEGVYPPCSSFHHCVPGIPEALGHVYEVPCGNYPGATHRVSNSYTNTGSTRRSPARPLATQGTRCYPQFTFTHNCPLVNFSSPWQTDLRCYVKH